MPSLAERLRNDTRALHTQAERSPFVAALFSGRMERSPYCALLRNLHAIYAHLEPALAAHATHPALAPILLPGLPRAQRLADDLRALHGTGWETDLAVLPAGRAYAQRLRQLAQERPELLLAHAYVRYLGDLSGGQILRPIVVRSLALTGGLTGGLGGGLGASFHDFGDATACAELTRAFRSGLARIVLDDAATGAVVAEARAAFERHCSLFDELQAACTA